MNDALFCAYAQSKVSAAREIQGHRLERGSDEQRSSATQKEFAASVQEHIDVPRFQLAKPDGKDFHDKSADHKEKRAHTKAVESKTDMDNYQNTLVGRLKQERRVGGRAGQAASWRGMVDTRVGGGQRCKCFMTVLSKGANAQDATLPHSVGQCLDIGVGGAVGRAVQRGVDARVGHELHPRIVQLLGDPVEGEGGQICVGHGVGADWVTSSQLGVRERGKRLDVVPDQEVRDLQAASEGEFSERQRHQRPSRAWQEQMRSSLRWINLCKHPRRRTDGGGVGNQPLT
jgi:hypothetical protein